MTDATGTSSRKTVEHKPTIVERARGGATHAVDRTRETASHAADTTRESARDAAKRTGEAIEGNPISALIGGVALGVALGALLPRTQVEREHLGPLGKKITDGATAAARAARDVGKDELSALAPDRDSAKAKVGSIFESVAAAAKQSARGATKG